MKYFWLSLIIIFLSYSRPVNTDITVVAENTVQPADTITSINELEERAVYKTKTGRYLRVHFVSNPDDLEKEEKEVVITDSNGQVSRETRLNKICDNENIFDGVYRRAAKTSVVTGLNKTQNHATLSSFLKSIKTINTSTLKMTKTSRRWKVEDKKINLSSAFLYAIARESDEDYHIIIGSTAKKSTAEFFNAECSGLPSRSSASYVAIKAARNKVVNFLNGEVCKVGYTFFEDVPKIRISGSLFYDKEHESRTVGPTGHKPKTAWELHPITEFVLL